MNQKMMLMALSALVLAVVTGWLLASSGTVAAQSNGGQEPRRCIPSFYVPEIRADGLALLVEQCSGTSWYFDDGWDGMVKVGEPTWRRVRWGQSN